MSAPLRVLPNVTAMARAFLIADPDVGAHVAGRVYAKVPETKVYPLCRVVRFGGIPTLQVPLELDTARLQVDVWADTEKAAERVLQTIRAALAARFPGAQNFGPDLAGVITHVDIGSMSEDPDDVFDPPKPRCRCDLTVGYRPS